jgi:hypothetical protein
VGIGGYNIEISSIEIVAIRGNRHLLVGRHDINAK